MNPHKQEGDGTTPEGLFDIASVMYGNEPNPGVSYPYHQLVCGDWWDEDSLSATYNRFVHVPCGEADPPFDNGSSEALWEETEPYPYFAVIAYNTADTPGLGSAIFLHASGDSPTVGCVSIPVSGLKAVLDWLQPKYDPLIYIAAQ